MVSSFLRLNENQSFVGGSVKHIARMSEQSKTIGGGSFITAEVARN